MSASNETDKLKLRCSHMSAYDLVERPDGVIKDAIMDAAQQCKTGNLNVAVRTNSETLQSEVAIVINGNHPDPFGFDNGGFEEKTTQRITVTKEEAKNFFGEEPIVTAAALGRPLVRNVSLWNI